MNFFIGFRELFYQIWLLLFFCLIGCQQAKVSSNLVSEEDLKQLLKLMYTPTINILEVISPIFLSDGI